MLIISIYYDTSLLTPFFSKDHFHVD